MLHSRREKDALRQVEQGLRLAHFASLSTSEMLSIPRTAPADIFPSTFKLPWRQKSHGITNPRRRDDFSRSPGFTQRRMFPTHCSLYELQWSSVCPMRDMLHHRRSNRFGNKFRSNNTDTRLRRGMPMIRRILPCATKICLRTCWGSVTEGALLAFPELNICPVSSASTGEVGLPQVRACPVVDIAIM